MSGSTEAERTCLGEDQSCLGSLNRIREIDPNILFFSVEFFHWFFLACIGVFLLRTFLFSMCGRQMS